VKTGLLPARLVTFIAAFWIVVVVIWRLFQGNNGIAPPHVAIWLFLAGSLSQVVLWLAHRKFGDA
jgi:hypothetical protein